MFDIMHCRNWMTFSMENINIEWNKVVEKFFKISNNYLIIYNCQIENCLKPVL